MAGDSNDVGASYSSAVGLIFIFNLIVGTGALTMPNAFSGAGWLLSLILVIVLAFTSFLTVTFVVESMAAANAILKARHIQKARSDNDNDDDEVNDKTPLLHGTIQYQNKRHGSRVHAHSNEMDFYSTSSELSEPFSDFSANASTDIHEMDLFEISERVELGQMAKLFFNKVGLNLFYICIAIYLYGDLAIYAAAVPKSLLDVACTYSGNTTDMNSTVCNNITMYDSCWETVNLVRADVYRIFVVVFTLLLGPFVFFNVQKTKYLQIFTSLMRWTAFLIMIVLAAIRLGEGKGAGHPAVVDFGGIPNLFGVCVYSFMCHHSLPSLVTPIGDKSKLTRLFAYDFVLILGFYCVLSFTGIFTFNRIDDLYTLNFAPSMCGKSEEAITNVVFLEYFLILFPVFTLSTSFPIIGITLRNNLKAICYKEDRPYPFIVDRIFFPLLALIPPVCVSLGTWDLSLLVGFTGSYAGAAIQYIIPALLVFYARRDVHNYFGHSMRNKHRSIFRHNIWIILIIVWAALAIILVTVNHILTGIQ